MLVLVHAGAGTDFGLLGARQGSSVPPLNLSLNAAIMHNAAEVASTTLLALAKEASDASKLSLLNCWLAIG